MTLIGMVGVGDMGSEMVPHLVAEGHQVWAFDPTRTVEGRRGGRGEGRRVAG